MKSAAFSPTKLLNFEFDVFRILRDLPLRERSILVGCSGGIDSTALALCLSQIQGRLGISRIALVHVHHGFSSDPNVMRARREALLATRKLARDLEIECHLVRPGRGWDELRSEAELRNFRRFAIRKVKARGGYDFVALAHHSDDLLETRLIRLLRGTGPFGLEAMALLRQSVLRPFLKISRAQIKGYLDSRKRVAVDDPTNRDLKPLRNWIRHSWLPELERKRPGSGKALARSLELLLEALPETSPAEVSLTSAEATGFDSGFDRDQFSQLEISERRGLLVGLLRSRGVREFSHSQVEELHKRLMSQRSSVKFEMLSLRWEINAKRIRAER